MAVNARTEKFQHIEVFDKNVDFCGILNLLSALKKAGFPKAELEQVAARIAAQTGATIPISF